MSYFIDKEKFIVIHCCECHIAFAITEDFWGKRIRDHKLFSCPEGHKQHYKQESDIDKANRLAREAQEKAERLQKCIDHKKHVIRQKDYQARNYKGQVTKLKKRIGGNT
jgi:hypothetical protein